MENQKEFTADKLILTLVNGFIVPMTKEQYDEMVENRDSWED